MKNYNPNSNRSCGCSYDYDNPTETLQIRRIGEEQLSGSTIRSNLAGVQDHITVMYTREYSGFNLRELEKIINQNIPKSEFDKLVFDFDMERKARVIAASRLIDEIWGIKNTQRVLTKEK